MHWRRNREVNRGKQCWEQRVLFKAKQWSQGNEIRRKQVDWEWDHAWSFRHLQPLGFSSSPAEEPWRAVKVMTLSDQHQILTHKLRVSFSWQMTEWTMKVRSLEADCWPFNNFENSCERSAWLSARPIWSREYHLRRLGKVMDPSYSLDNTM